MIKNKAVIGAILAVIVLLIASIALKLAASMSILASLRIVFGSVYVLFLPGFVISFIFFQKDKIDWIERVALSFALSIAVVPLAVFYLNLVGMRISLLSSSLTVLGIMAVSGLVLLLKGRDKKHA